MSMKDMVSIIVPVYNVEKYLDKCVDSIVHQSYKELEIILVDDGSKDSSGQLCDKWKQIDNRIKVIHKPNAGLGYARNSGLDIATGKYIMFVDSDDFIDEKMVEKLYVKMQTTESDTVFCGLNRVYPDGRSVEVPAAYNDQSFEGADIINNVLLEMVGSKPQDTEDANLFMSVWHALYSKDVVDKWNIRFPSERIIMCEDIMFHIQYLRYASKVTYISEGLYYYRVNPKSVSQIYDRTRFERQKVLSEAIISELDKFVDPTEYLVREQRRFLGGARMQIQAIVGSKEKHKIKLIKEICEDSMIQEVLETYPFRNNPFRHRVFNICVKQKAAIVLWLLSKAIIFTRKKEYEC